MRLLDRVALCREPVHVISDEYAPAPFEVSGPACFATQVAACPLRFVLGDDLTRASAELAFADGARLTGCLDLVRIPAPLLWIEWNDAVYQRVIRECQCSAEFDAAAVGRRVGVLIQAATDGLSAIGRTFWAESPADAACAVTLSPVETHINLHGEFPDRAGAPDILSGGYSRVTDRDAAMASLLGHARFRFDASWLAYYAQAARSQEAKRRVVSDSLASVARDAPFLLAFMLLLTARDATRAIPVSRAAINQKRIAHGRMPLLDHVEVHACLDGLDLAESGGPDIAGRQSPRLHHVRGHLVRRDQRVFWRVPHLRGSACRGMIRSRTVCLSFARGHDADARL